MSNLERHFSNGAETLSHRWTTHTDGDYIPTTAWSANEKMLAAASEQGDIWFFSPDSRQPILSQHSAHEPGICSLSWHPRHPLMASSGQDGRVKIWLEGKALDQVETGDISPQANRVQNCIYGPCRPKGKRSYVLLPTTSAN